MPSVPRELQRAVVAKLAQVKSLVPFTAIPTGKRHTTSRVGIYAEPRAFVSGQRTGVIHFSV
jgi:hypothetical protein